MPSITFTLPTGPAERARVLWDHADRCRNAINARRVMWDLAALYLNGAREFSVFNATTGEVRAFNVGERGEMEFQGPEMIRQIDRVKSRIESMDLRPKILRQGSSLGMIRERAVAQVIGDGIVKDNVLANAKRQFAHLFTTLGCCGVGGRVENHPAIGVVDDLEIIHPLEIYPFPLPARDYTKTSGLMRERWVSYDWLKAKIGRKIADNRDKLEFVTVQLGNAVPSPDEDPGSIYTASGGAGIRTNYGMGYNQGGQSDRRGERDYVRLRELWIFGVAETVTEYSMCSGDYEMEYQKFGAEAAYCPIGFSTFMDNGTFWGVGMFDLSFAYAREFERMVRSLFRNVREMDRYPYLVLPGGAISDQSFQRDQGGRLRYALWTPDPMNERFDVTSIPPNDAGDMPGRTAQFAMELLDRISPIADLLEEKGRVDSAAGLQFLDEQIQRAFTSPTNGVQIAWGQRWRSAVSEAVRVLMGTGGTMPVTHLTLDLAGVNFDEDGTGISFVNNPIPNVSHLHFTVKETTPKSEVSRKAEALDLVQRQLLDPMGLKLYAAETGLDFAMPMGAELAGHEMGVKRLLMIYGDGDMPGEQPVILTPQLAYPELQIRQCDEFLKGAAVDRASPEVINELQRYRETLLAFMGMTLPEAVPLPEEAALFAPPPVDEEGNPVAGGMGGQPGMNGSPPTTGGGPVPGGGGGTPEMAMAGGGGGGYGAQ